MPELARRHGVHANQIYKWKKQFLDQAAVVFERDAEATGGGEREDDLLKILPFDDDYEYRSLESEQAPP